MTQNFSLDDFNSDNDYIQKKQISVNNMDKSEYDNYCQRIVKKYENEIKIFFKMLSGNSVKKSDNEYYHDLKEVANNDEIITALAYNAKNGIVLSEPKTAWATRNAISEIIANKDDDLYQSIFYDNEIIQLNWIDTSDMENLVYFFASNEKKPTTYDSWQRIQEKTEDFSGYMFNISKWNTSKVKSIEGIFAGNNNQFDISEWDVSNVENMSHAFAWSKFNGDISKWNTSKVKNTSYMFQHADFDGDISKWDVSRVIDMSYMFNEAKFDEDISNWNTYRVRNMDSMFKAAFMFAGDLSKWNVSHVENMDNMFSFSCYFDSDISKWNVSRVKTMSNMFHQANYFNQPIGSWDVSNVENMDDMFSFAHNFKQDLSKWDVGYVDSHKNMFHRDFPDKFKPEFLF